MSKLRLVIDSALYWHRNQAARHSAALTYYSLVSLAPMMVLLLAVAGLFFNPERAGRLITRSIAEGIGQENLQVLRTVIENAHNPVENITAGVISLLVIALTGSELFRQLSYSLNAFWRVEKSGEELPLLNKAVSMLARHLKYRLRAFLLVLGAGLLLISTLIASTVLGVGKEWITSNNIPFSLYIWINRLFSLASMALLFSLIFRYIPRVNLAWQSIWPGAIVTALLFTLLQQLMSEYFTNAGLNSAYGAAGSLVVLLFWLYYSIQAMFYGAAWTRMLENKKIKAQG